MVYDSTGMRSIGDFLLNVRPSVRASVTPNAQASDAEESAQRTAEVIAALRRAHALCKQAILENHPVVDVPSRSSDAREGDEIPVDPLPISIARTQYARRTRRLLSLISFLWAIGGFAWILLNVSLDHPPSAARAATQKFAPSALTALDPATPEDHVDFVVSGDGDPPQARYETDLLLHDNPDPSHLLFGYEREEVDSRIIPVAAVASVRWPERKVWDSSNIGWLPDGEHITAPELAIPETVFTITSPANRTTSLHVQTLDDVLTRIRILAGAAGVDVFKLSHEPPAPRVTVGRASIREMNTRERRGVEICFPLLVHKFAGRDLEVGAYFFTIDGKPVLDYDDQYASRRGNAYAKRIVAITEDPFVDHQFVLFMPYVQFDGLPGGRNRLATQVVVWSGAKFDHRMASGTKQTFTLMLYKFASANS